MGKTLVSGWGALGDSNVCQISHICCCGKQAGQAAHDTLASFRSWSSRQRSGCMYKQRQDQQNAAWAWHHKRRNYAFAALSFSPSSLEQPFASRITNIHPNSNTNTQATLACLRMSAHMHSSVCTYACLRALARLCYGHKHLLKQVFAQVLTHMFVPATSPSR